MTKAALLEQTVMSGSTAMIFLTRVTGGELAGVDVENGEFRECSRGSWVWPVTSFRGGIAVVLYGILVDGLEIW